ncbi:amidohydrolase family protein [Gimibacter soli]|uniref:Amidohydrolase family protein n=1 Tax=Gimibacter soli TaxID=3024400 RepID=A0AAE9XRK7_9PROT|nr:amidohydrolase family protein [Gimibacter soli]WCL55046.1 amidohydrolase family protein [Gimibacter soli]
MKMIRSMLALSLLAGVSAAAMAENIAVTGGTAYTKGGYGKVENATVLIADGKIQSVTAAGEVPEGYKVIDAAGKIVTVGLMVSETTLGLTEVGFSAGIDDGSAKGDASIPLDAADGINPDSVLIPVTRIEGVTRAYTGLEGSKDMWLGQGAVIHLGNGPDLVVKRHAALGLELDEGAASSNGGSRVALWYSVRSKLDGAKAGGKEDKDDKDKKEAKPDPEKDALTRVLKGEQPLLVQADRASDIRKVIELKKAYGVRVILVGAAEAWRVADELAAAQIPVIVNPVQNLPGSFDTLGATQENAARLHKAGVKIALVGLGTDNARLMPQYAGNAVANGLPWEAAMDAMTVNPAEMFGVADSYGTLEAGKDADVVVWSGDPLELSSAPDHVLIKGEEIPLVSRQTKLAARYHPVSRAPEYKR